jgi:hypothetical protein
MDDESEPSERTPQPRMSMTPSWIMLGFVLGALFVVALPPFENEKPSPPVERPEPPEPAAPPTPPQISTVEAVFAEWGENAVWDDNVTEIALWNTGSNRFSDFFEVRRHGDLYYFRSIPRLTRRVINHGKPLPLNCPLQFTETEERYREWLEHGRTERRPQPAVKTPSDPR